MGSQQRVLIIQKTALYTVIAQQFLPDLKFLSSDSGEENTTESFVIQLGCLVRLFFFNASLMFLTVSPDVLPCPAYGDLLLITA